MPDKVSKNARVRENQRRSRARRAEYLKSLEDGLRTRHASEVTTAVEVQSAARHVLRQNGVLRRWLSQSINVSPSTLETWLSMDDQSAEARFQAHFRSMSVDKSLSKVRVDPIVPRDEQLDRFCALMGHHVAQRSSQQCYFRIRDVLGTSISMEEAVLRLLPKAINGEITASAVDAFLLEVEQHECRKYTQPGPGCP